MRWPLRYQIMLPVLGLTLVSLVAVSLLNAYLAADRVRKQIETQLTGITTTLSHSAFPLTEPVLLQMRGLSGAEFVLLNDTEQVIAASLPSDTLTSLPRQLPDSSDAGLRQRVSIGGVDYFHTAKRLDRYSTNRQSAVLHVLYPETDYRRAWTDAVYPPLAIGLAASALVVLLTMGVASRLSRPINQLQAQVARIARGDFSPMHLPPRSDEIQDLARAINQMANMLARYEHDVRQTERLRMWAQLGGGIAHQMRNAVTGCRMALDILAEEHSLPQDGESLMVARRQLELMERYVRRFIARGQSSVRTNFRVADLGAIVGDLIPLLRPAAQHAGVDLQWQSPETRIEILADAEDLEQLIINLLLNAIEASSEAGAKGHGLPVVRVVVKRTDSGLPELLVQDSGDGPPETVQDTLFEPFVTSKRDGIGLGLSVAKQVVEQHDGQISWHRDSGFTSFHVTFPQLKSEACCV